MNFGETESRVSRPLLSKVEALKAESFYYVRYGSSIIIMSKIPSKILNNENIKTAVSRKIGILVHVLSWRQQKHQCLCFHYWDYLTSFWWNNWRSIIDVTERLCFHGKKKFTVQAVMVIIFYSRTIIFSHSQCVFSRLFSHRDHNR